MKPPNPNIDFENSAFFVNTRLQKWQCHGFPLRAGVSSFGMGSTNANVILEDFSEGTGGLAPLSDAPLPDAHLSREYQLILLSAKTDTALENKTRQLSEYIKNQKNNGLNTADAAYTLSLGRRDFNQRRFLISPYPDLEETINNLRELTPGLVFDSFCETLNRPVIFMFPGQGTQYVDMCKGLYEKEPVFRENIDKCEEIFIPRLEIDLREVVFYKPGDDIEENAAKLNQTRITQSALFMIEYAAAGLWMAWGIKPKGMIGHSIGKLVAACISGCMSLENAIEIVALRDRAMGDQEPGAMLALGLNKNDILPLLDEDLCLATVNSPKHTVVSSKTGAIAKLEEEACSPQYWARQLRETVRLSNGITEILKESSPILLEVGPGTNLGVLAKEHQKAVGETPAVILSSIRHFKQTESDLAFLLKTLGNLWLSGVTIDWKSFFNSEKRQRIPLPGYPFERKHYWLEEIKDWTPTAEFDLETVETAGSGEEAEPGAPAPGTKTFQPRPQLKVEYSPPANEIQEAIVAIWEDILGVRPVGIYNNFFDLGGHSLLATLFLSRLQEELGIRLDLKTIFEKVDIAGIAGLVQEQAPGNGQAQNIESLLDEIEGLSEEEIQRALSHQESQKSTDKE